jgi:hypothetical protein
VVLDGQARRQRRLHEATASAEAIRRAILLPARKPPEWLRQAAATAEAQLLAENPPEADSASYESPPSPERSD